MNETQRRDYEGKNTRRMKRFERQFLAPMYHTLDAEFKRAAEMYQAGKIGDWYMDIGWIPGLADQIQDIYDIVGVFYATKTLQEINRSAREEKGFGKDEEWIALVQSYFRTKLLTDAVLPISNTTRDAIREILLQGEEEGWGIEKMVRELRNSDIPLYRARTIIRTELVKAQSFAKTLGAEESQWETEKRWIVAHDNRTRHTHRSMDGVKIAEGDKFQVPRRKGGYDQMTGPGDPNGSAENIINCRCTTAVVAKRDENGRLIRKRRISVLLPDSRPRQVVVTI